MSFLVTKLKSILNARGQHKTSPHYVHQLVAAKPKKKTNILPCGPHKLQVCSGKITPFCFASQFKTN